MDNQRSDSVLVIESNHFMGNLISRFLESAGFKTYLIQDFSEAFDIAEKYLPSLILCSFQLNGGSGFELLTELSECHKTRTIPFIFVSTPTPNLDDIRKGVLLGADSFIFRPFSAKEMLTIIRNKLEKTRLIKERGLSEYISDAWKSPDRQINNNILIDFNRKRKLINKNDIEYVIANGAYTNVYIIGKGKIMVRRLLKEWEHALSEDNFIKIHRSVILNINHINEVESFNSRSLKISMKNSNEEFVTSQRYTVKVRLKLIG